MSPDPATTAGGPSAPDVAQAYEGDNPPEQHGVGSESLAGAPANEQEAPEAAAPSEAPAEAPAGAPADGSQEGDPEG